MRLFSESDDPLALLRRCVAVVDVRAPIEYSVGHFPSARSLPLFSDEERATVGTLYKREGPEAAFSEGLRLVGPKLSQIVDLARQLVNGHSDQKSLGLYCARGGMRSRSVGWLLAQAGISVVLLTGGYRRLRRWVLHELSKERTLAVIGGRTGAGKTEALEKLHKCGEQVIDLEALACHRGSVFGATDRPQPTQQQFENCLAMALAPLALDQPIWVEDESRSIGSCTLPDPLFAMMQSAPLYVKESADGDRLARLLKEYGIQSEEMLLTAARRIRTRIGGERLRRYTAAVTSGNLSAAARVLLEYYDKTYDKSLLRRTGPILSWSDLPLRTR